MRGFGFAERQVDGESVREVRVVSSSSRMESVRRISSCEFEFECESGEVRVERSSASVGRKGRVGSENLQLELEL